MEWGLEGRDLLLARPGSQAGRPCQVGGRLPRALSLHLQVGPADLVCHPDPHPQSQGEPPGPCQPWDPRVTVAVLCVYWVTTTFHNSEAPQSLGDTEDNPAAPGLVAKGSVRAATFRGPRVPEAFTCIP